MSLVEDEASKPRKKNPFEGVTPEKYSRMLKAFMELEQPTPSKIAEHAQVGHTMVKRALKEGWPKLGLPPLSEAAAMMKDPNEVHAQMSGMAEAKKAIVKNLFGPLPGAPAAAPVPQAAIDEAKVRQAELGMASRVSMSLAVKSARAVEALAEQLLLRLEAGEIDLPDEIRPEHIFLLAKAADTAAAAVNKSVKTERLFNGQPEEVAGSHVVALIAGATPEELKLIAETGQLPLRLLGLPEPLKGPVIDVTAYPIELDEAK